MDQKHEDADEPLVGEVTEQDQVSGQSVVQGILEVVALRPDADMAEEDSKLLPELNHVE